MTLFPLFMSLQLYDTRMAHLVFVRCTQRREKIISKHTAQYQLYLPPLIRFDHFSLLNTKMLSCMNLCTQVGIIYIICFCLARESPLFEPFSRSVDRQLNHYLIHAFIHNIGVIEIQVMSPKQPVISMTIMQRFPHTLYLVPLPGDIL